MAGKYFDEWQIGDRIEHEIRRTVTETDNLLFSTMTHNPQPLHIDAHFAARTEFGKPLFNSLYTLSILIGMSIYDTTLGTTLGNLAMNDIVFPRPVFAGDTLRAHTRVLSARPSKSRPGQGIVEFEHTATNQHGEVVAVCRRTALMMGRPTQHSEE